MGSNFQRAAWKTGSFVGVLCTEQETRSRITKKWILQNYFETLETQFSIWELEGSELSSRDSHCHAQSCFGRWTPSAIQKRLAYVSFYPCLRSSKWAAPIPWIDGSIQRILSDHMYPAVLGVILFIGSRIWYEFLLVIDFEMKCDFVLRSIWPSLRASTVGMSSSVNDSLLLVLKGGRRYIRNIWSDKSTENPTQWGRAVSRTKLRKRDMGIFGTAGLNDQYYHIS
jgi:hypothetical protein